MPRIVTPYDDLTHTIIGAAMRVHRRLPRGLYERHYQAALTAELTAVGLAVPEEYHREVYDGEVWLGRLYVDHWVNECVVVEDKAFARGLGDKELAQVVTYLSALQAPVGLLLNFGRPSLEFRRVLPARGAQRWRDHIGPYLWRPPTPDEAGPNRDAPPA
jgi:GxxExxY protein